MDKIVLFVVTLGIIVQLTTAQELTTKCPSNDWTKYLERCYLPVGFSHSWSRAYNYCQKYGAKLAEPTGYVINDEVISILSRSVPDAKTFWIGYNRRASSSREAYIGYWSDNRTTSVEVGVWGHNEPDTSAGQCVYVQTADHKWYMDDCGRVRNFMCELNPCPGGVRDTYMCNGKCFNRSVLCNGINDCGNNQDEENCRSLHNSLSLETTCSFLQEGTNGEIMFPANGSLYYPDRTCIWTIKTSPGRRISFSFEYFKTELDTDILEVWDGGPTLSSSQIAARLSGTLSQYNFTSSYNFLILRFVSDSSMEYQGFKLIWKTNFTCSYSFLDNYGYSNTNNISLSEVRLGSRQTTDTCKETCNVNAQCYGFRYSSSSRICYLLTMLPVLQTLPGSSLYIKTCFSDTTVQGSIPFMASQHVAITTVKQLATPLYPFTYPGNLEFEYTITTSGNNLIQLEVLLLDLCCGDMIFIFDKDRDLLETLTSESSPKIVLSTGNVVYIKMDLKQHWRCYGALIHYKKGCDLILSGSGEVTSPGYGTSKSYPDLATCSWKLNAPSSDRSVTVIFDDFQMNTLDFVIIQYPNGSYTEHTGVSLHGVSLTSESYLLIMMETSSLDNALGFKASFSPGCPVLDDTGYILSSNSFNFGDSLNVSCGNGFYFSGAFAGKTSVRLTCLSGGLWSEPNIPVCTRGVCGPPVSINNGYIVSSSGARGGDVTTYACNNGFSLVGKTSITCRSNNTWEAPPSCVSPQCPTLTPSFTILYGNGTNHGSVVSLTCPQFNEIIGAQLVQCRTGLWDFASGNQSYCSPVQCETPVVENAVLSPSAPYVMNQNLTAKCVDGYVMTGSAFFRCGSNDQPPTCSKKTCNLAQFSRVIPDNGLSVMNYMYGDSVSVTCEASYYMSNIPSTNMTITCLQTGNWSHTPICSKKSCGDPYQIPGSVYNISCYEHNCSFVFRCKNAYELFGSSSKNDATVRCGYKYDGLWDFGNLRCIGGQCPDPGYPASGKLVGTSFEEGAKVTFECTQTGFQPLESSGLLSTGMTCRYNELVKGMYWVGEMPVCNDTQTPTIINCDTGQLSYPISNLKAPSYNEPVAMDNNAVKSWKIFPENFRPNQPVSEAITVNYVAEDFHGNIAVCRVAITIPASIDCKNSNAFAISLTSDTVIYGDNPSYFERKSGLANVTFVPPFITVKREADSLNRLFEIQVTSRHSLTNVLLDTCTLQFRFNAPQCATWAFNIANGSKTCSTNACTVVCDQGFYFMENPTAAFINMGCTPGTGWDRLPPVCASSTQNYIIYTASYNYKYYIVDGVSDQTACVSAYTPTIKEKLVQFASAMKTKCNSGSLNPVNVTLIENTLNVGYSLATKRGEPVNLAISFEFQLILQDETIGNAQLVKDTCSNTIQTSLNLQQDISTISSLSAIVSPQCGSGVYDLSSTQPVFEYKCQGNRKFVSINGNRLCLECPLGYYIYMVGSNASCLACPAGTYGFYSMDGTRCETCPNRANPNLIAQTNVSSCYFKEACREGFYSFDGLAPCTPCPKNFYSSLPYSRSCTACLTNQITYNNQSTSYLDCKTLQDVAAEGGTSPCTANPCRNGGTCTLVRSNYMCTCALGYTGRTCESVFDNCTSNPCKNGQGCTTSIGNTFTCDCNINPPLTSELSGRYCEIDNVGCGTTFCKNNGTCHNQLGNFMCKCPSYSGYMNADGTCNTLINPCNVNPCQQGTCIPNENYYKTCNCYPGWTGILCDKNIDDCTPNYCQNGAVCVDGVNSFRCNCSDTFHGPYCQFRSACQRKCSSSVNVNCNTCVDNNTAACVDINDGFQCRCREGFKGRSCEIKVSVCNSNPCKHGGICTEALNATYSCNCPHPWTGQQCEAQINYCPAGNQCFNGGTCFSTSSGYKCSCPANFISANCSVAYDLCARANPCVGNGSSCSMASNNTFQCSCQTGYNGNICENHLATCTADLCKNGGTCAVINNVVKCTCMNGFTGSVCEANINECSPNPCQSNQECVDGIGSYTCICAPGKRGADCRDLNQNFDYVLTPNSLVGQCRTDVSLAVFGDGTTPISSLSVAFWVRFTAFNGNDVIMNIFGSRANTESIPSTPDFILTIAAANTYLDIQQQTTGRRKRSVDTLSYPTIADGFWHHIAVVWTKLELTIFVDNSFADQVVKAPTGTSNGISTGFVVFGDYDAVSGTVNKDTSFQGRISRLYVGNIELSASQIANLYSRVSTPPGIILNQERSLLLLYPVDYNSELKLNSEKCLIPTDSSCPRLNSGATVPSIISCPGDSFVITQREGFPNWTQPVFSGTKPFLSNIINGGFGLTWGVHGISYAYFDNENDAAVCTFRLFNNEVGCGKADGSGSACTNTSQGGVRCTAKCSNSQALPGDIPLYQTCSMYGMWDEAVKYSDYIYPSCSGAGDLTRTVSLDVTAVPIGANCSEIREVFSAYVLSKFTELNNHQPSNNKLCIGGCQSYLIPAFSCEGKNIRVQVNFGLKNPNMEYDHSPVTPEELMKIAVGDFGAFDYTDGSNPSKRAAPDYTSLVINAYPRCVAGYMQSGSQCVQCGKGTYYSSATMSCVRCPKGSYRSDISNVTSRCTNCHTSQTTPSDGATESSYCISNCLAGKYYKFPQASVSNFPINQGSCEDCPVGFYQDNSGQISCNPCQRGYTTATAGATSLADCVTYDSLTTTPKPFTLPSIGESVEQKKVLGAGEIVAIIIGILIFLAIIILVILFCCCKDRLPCLSKKKQVVSPVAKDGYYAKKYGENDMQFVSYNLQDVREKKGKPLDRVPFVESEETGSVKTDISVHVPVFLEKMDGKVKKKSMYMTNGGQNMSISLRSGRTPRDPMMTSSPRETQCYNQYEEDGQVKPKQKRRRKKRQDRSTSERRSRHRYEDEDMEPVNGYAGGPLPKALAPLPTKLKSVPPDNVLLRPSSALEQPRVQVIPSQYEDFLDQSPSRIQRSYHSHLETPDDEEQPRSRSQERSRSKSKEKSRSRRKDTYHDDEENVENDRKSRERSQRKHRDYDEYGYEDVQPHSGRYGHQEQKRIEVESDDEDLR